jgi:hypothetical protein
MVMEKKLFGMLNTDLSIRIPTQYESIQVMKDCNKKTVFNVKQNGKHGILDKSGNTLLETVYDDIGYSCPYSISKGGKYGLFDASFSVLIPAALRPLFNNWSGDQGLGKFWRQNPMLCEIIHFSDKFRDVDVPEDREYWGI